MRRTDFEKMIDEELPRAVPEKFWERIKNVAILVEDEPSAELRKERGLADNETLLGLYSGVPLTVRGDNYGIGMTVPDTITLYQKPIEEAARSDDSETIRTVVRETLWHEVGHYFGLSDEEIEKREEKNNLLH
jgi:predicted Zn-dependent protease with MMP-like domain